jgi:hypothetical protein
VEKGGNVTLGAFELLGDRYDFPYKIGINDNAGEDEVSGRCLILQSSEDEGVIRERTRISNTDRLLIM